MLFDFDGELMNKAARTTEEPQRPPYLVVSIRSDMPAIHCNVALDAPGQDPANLPDFPEGIAMFTLTLGWATRNPLDAAVHLAGLLVPVYLGLSCSHTLYEYWPIDCQFGIFVRFCFMLASVATFLATVTRIHLYRIAPWYKTIATDPRKQADNPFLRVRMGIYNTMQKLNTVLIWATLLDLYFLFVHTQDPSCNTLCCTPDGGTLNKGLETGGGTAIMVPDGTNRHQMMVFPLLPVLTWFIWTQFGRDPVEDQTMHQYDQAVKRERMAHKAKHGGG